MKAATELTTIIKIIAIAIHCALFMFYSPKNLEISLKVSPNISISSGVL